jgi:spermidine/putrescine transport system substrate-binding protein
MTGGPEPTGLTFNDALALKLEEAGWTRRDFLSRVAALGAATALTQLLIACGARQPGQATQQVAAETALPTAGPTLAPGATAGPTAAPTPVPQPESELNVYNWSYYIGRDTRDKFEQTYGIKLNYDKFPDENTQIGKVLSDGKGGGYDVTYPASTWIPSFIEQGVIQKLDHSLIPNMANLLPEWRDPAYDPGSQYSVPYSWWTTGYAWNPDKIPADLTSWDALWDAAYTNRLSMLDDMRECFAAGAFHLGLDPNTTDLAQLDQILAELEAQKPIVKRYTTDHIADMLNGVVDIAHCWSGDWIQMTYDKPKIRYVIPAEGSIKGNDVFVVLSGAQHPIAAHLWINFNLDAQISADNTNYIGYMGPNEAALPLLKNYIVNDPRINPPAELLATLIELKYLPPAELQAYTDRWTSLRAS